jgi:putative ABC transport system ATP-binding protein
MIARLRGIKKTYRLGRTDIEALQGVDLDIEKGELSALVGPSGSGKTTLLNILGCLDTPTSGTYELAGKPIVARDFDQLASIRARDIGFVFQTFNLIPVLNVIENVELPMLCSGTLSRRERRERVIEVIEAVGLTPFTTHRPDELSGGQRQRVAIARAVAPAPGLILADEPTASLDSVTALGIVDLFVKLNKERGSTILFSTHDPRVLTHVGRLIRLRDGRLDPADGSPAPAPTADRGSTS